MISSRAVDPETHPRCVRVERTIAAPAAHVWQVLVDFARYPEWNPFTYGVEVTRGIGGPVTLHVALGGKKLTMHERLTRWDEGRAVAWGVRWGGGLLLDCDRVQSLEPIDETTTRYRGHEAFDGLLAPLVIALYRRPLEEGFAAAADALARRAELTYAG